MSENNNIKLDPDVLNQQQNTKVPLSDLYGIPVFSPETDRMAEKVKANETDAVTQIEQQIFGERVSGENQEIQKIRNQLFQMQTGLTKETVESRKQIGLNHTHFLVVPHLLGTITNLDGSESMRALASVKAELARRQRVFSTYGVNHINGYMELFKAGEAKEPIPHLFIISDEFAELKKEQPEFMKELVSAARIGRSLGVHLILATQKPTGVVDDQIWSNSKFKLCLKVQNEGDSKEVLKTPDAASITLPGRAYLQVGNNEIYELFQSAWSGAIYIEEKEKDVTLDERIYKVNEIGQGELINQDLSGKKAEKKAVKTQLEVIIEHIKKVYESEKQIPVKKPWLPPLQNMIVSPYAKEEKQPPNKWGWVNLNISIGKMDIPELQSQKECNIDFFKEGNLLFVASSGYGKTLFLTTILMSLAKLNDVDFLNFYILDYGNGGMMSLKALDYTDFINHDSPLGVADEIDKAKKKDYNFEVFPFGDYNTMDYLLDIKTISNIKNEKKTDTEVIVEDISSLLFSKGIDKVMFPEYSTILQMIANVQSNRENNAKIDRNITGIQLGNYLESLYMSGNIVYEDKGEIFLKNNTIDDVKLNVSIHLYNKSHSDITIEQLVAGLDEKNSNEVKVLDEYTKWFKSPDDVGMAGKSKVEEYLGDLRSIMQNYANEHPEIKLTNLESLSEEQLRELIKKKENSWYVIKDSIMED